jgi:hypothetical protein
MLSCHSMCFAFGTVIGLFFLSFAAFCQQSAVHEIRIELRGSGLGSSANRKLVIQMGLRNSYKQSVYIPTTVGFSVTAPAESSFICSVRKKGNHVAQTHSLSHAMHQLREAIW